MYGTLLVDETSLNNIEIVEPTYMPIPQFIVRMDSHHELS